MKGRFLRPFFFYGAPMHALLVRTLGSVFAIAWSGFLPAFAQAVVPPMLDCTFNGLSAETSHRFYTEQSPYEAGLVQVNDHFRFRAVLLSADGVNLDSVAMYTYYPARGKSVLIHAVHYAAPFPSERPAVLGGTHRVYSPIYEREIRYACQLKEVQP